MPDFEKQLRKMAVQEHRRVIVCSRTLNGAVRLFAQPWTLILPLLLAIFAALAWYNRGKLSLPSENSVLPQLAVLWQIILSALIVVFSFLSFWGILALLGTPHHAKQIDAALVHIGLVDRYGVGPALLSSRRIKGSSAQILEFWSKGISLDAWEDKRRAIEDVLNVHMVEAPTYGGRKGNNRRRICLTVAPGAGNQPTAVLYEDDEL